MSQSVRIPARWSVLAAFAALLAACAAAPQSPPTTEGPVSSDGPTEPTEPATPRIDLVAPFASSGHPGIDAWRMDFASRAAAQGRDPAAVRAVLSDLSPLDIYLSTTVTPQSAISQQAEFAKPIWEYLRTAVSTTRKETGADQLDQLDSLFDRLEAAYGVDRAAITAIWGMETNFGSYIGSFDAANTLANMAVEGRRQRFAESELIALMKIVEAGYAERDDLVSGWAGAMGQTQFMPSTFLAHARDFSGDGRIDVWDNTADALASAANYLAISGYEFGEPWGLEVSLPEDFDYAIADGRERRVGSWRDLGVTVLNGSRDASLNASKYAELWVPAGHRGPKFLLFKNFNVFKTYNRADSYALAVGLLSDGVSGQPGLSVNWPVNLQPLTIAQVKQLQAGLNGLGFNAGPVDGIAGRGTKGALRDFQAANGFIADGFPTTDMLAYVLSASEAG